jgi:hypothetical protein
MYKVTRYNLFKNNYFFFFLEEGFLPLAFPAAVLRTFF